MLFCNQRKQNNAPSIVLDKNQIKVVTEATFLGVVFNRTLSYNNHVNYIKADFIEVAGRSTEGQTGTLPCLDDPWYDLSWTIRVVLYMGQPGPCKTRKEDIVLNRLLIGHTYVMFSFILKNKQTNKQKPKSLLSALHVILLLQ